MSKIDFAKRDAEWARQKLMFDKKWQEHSPALIKSTGLEVAVLRAILWEHCPEEKELIEDFFDGEGYLDVLPHKYGGRL